MAESGFRTDVLDRAVREERRRRELARTAKLELLFTALPDAPVAVQDAIVFGSLARPNAFTARSDIDIAVHRLPARDYMRLKTYLEDALVRDVDLVELESCRFADAIRRKGIRWTRSPE